jgi:DNA-binding MarR family transcriptional regulator
MLAASIYPLRRVNMRGEDEYAVIGRQLVMFLRRWHRMQDKRGGSLGPGLDRTAFMLLSYIAKSGTARLSTLAGEMCVDPSVVSRQVAALEAAGLITRTGDPADRRASVITTSPAGAELFEHHRERFAALLRTLLDDWTPAERADFGRLLGRFNGALAAHEEGTLKHGDN